MRNVYLMYSIVFLQGFVFYGPVATLFRQARGLSMSEIFIIESISWVLIIILEVPWGWISDRFGYKKTLVLVNTLFFLSKIVFYKAHSFESFLLERIMISVVLSGLSGCDTALIYGSIHEEEAQSVFGKYSAYGALGFIIASLLSTFIVARSIDDTALFTIYPYALSAILTLFLVEVKVENQEKSNILKNFKRAFSHKSILFFVLSIALVVEVVQAITVFLNQAQYMRSGIEPKYFGVIIAAIQCVRLLSVKSNAVSKKMGSINAISMLMGFILGASLLLLLTDNPILSIAAVLILSVSASLMGPIELDVKNKWIDTSDRATILSIYSMVGGIVASIGNVAIGKAADHSLHDGLVICLIMSVLAFALLKVYMFLNKETHQKDKITQLKI
ncbi:MFS transporter [Fusibacter ferrireducens]|nr:MFS transporter [Fusibacter ferrireducens]